MIEAEISRGVFQQFTEQAEDTPPNAQDQKIKHGLFTRTVGSEKMMKVATTIGPVAIACGYAAITSFVSQTPDQLEGQGLKDTILYMSKAAIGTGGLALQASLFTAMLRGSSRRSEASPDKRSDR